MEKLYLFLRGSWKGLLAFAVLGLSVLVWQFSVSDQLVFRQADTGFAVKTQAGQIFLEEGQVSHGDWAMAFAAESTPQKETTGVLYKDIQPGVDLRWYDKGEKLAGYDVIIEPGVDPADVRIDLQGQAEAAFIKNDQLVLPQTDGTAIVHSKPVSYQEIDGEKVAVASAFQLVNDDLAFEVGTYDPANTLVIDPIVFKMVMFNSCPNNLLINGSFEDDLDQNGTTTLSPPPGWIGGTSEIPAPFCLTPNIDGLAFGFTIPDNGHVMYQEVSSSPGDVFTLNFLTYSHVDNGQRVEIQFFDSGTPIGAPFVHIISQFGECDYESAQLVTGPSPSNASHVRISAIGAAGLDVFNGAAKVDGMCLTKVNVQPPCPDPNCGSVSVQVIPNTTNN